LSNGSRRRIGGGHRPPLQSTVNPKKPGGPRAWLPRLWRGQWPPRL
jgi:hypothetical protein